VDQGPAEFAAMTTSEHVQIFGYGSLVNRRTRRAHLVAGPARASGWRRSWSHCVETENGKVCALTIVPNAEAEVAGVVVLEHRDHLPALDAREIGYQRVPISVVADEPPILPAPGHQESFSYTSTSAAYRRGSREFPIWRSYLECVLSGFLDLGGDVAARNFIVSTDGWDAPILDDRSAPKYMRAVQLSEDIRREVDALIRSLGLDRTQFADPSALLSVGQRPAYGDELA
jgi:cation transport protein ChaC